MNPAIPRCMSTQHPDNVTVPFFASSPILAGEDEIREAFYAFSHLGCDEQMWDVEGKDIDAHVIRKFLTFYPDYFSTTVLGRDVRVTLRVPNPLCEKAEAKILLETLESIPRSTDTARLFYGTDVVPIFEVIMPMTMSVECINRVYRYYLHHISARQDIRLQEDDITIKEWVGDFSPARIDVIPLIEDVPTMLRAADIVAEYLADKEIRDQRVFLARSDTAMNYGCIAAALANKIALARLDELARRTGVRIHPILGMGSAPFRGGLTPQTVIRTGAEYPSVVTFTIQSAFKFDYPVEEVRGACHYLKTREIKGASPIDAFRALEILERYSDRYRKVVVSLAPLINLAAKYVPPRRARKLHIGLFGYARGLDGVSLPRAISFTCALYSLGLPPELIGLDSLTDEDLSFIRDCYPSFEAKLAQALAFADLECPLMGDSLRRAIERIAPPFEADEEHIRLSRHIRASLDKGNTALTEDLVLRAARIRRFLG